MGALHGQRRTLLLLFFLFSAVLLFDAVLLSYRDRLTFTPRAATVPQSLPIASDKDKILQAFQQFAEQTIMAATVSAGIRDKALVYEQSAAQLSDITKNPHPDETVQTQRINSSLYQVNMNLDGVTNSINTYYGAGFWYSTVGRGAKWVGEKTGIRGETKEGAKDVIDSTGKEISDLIKTPGSKVAQWWKNRKKDAKEVIPDNPEELRDLLQKDKNNENAVVIEEALKELDSSIQESDVFWKEYTEFISNATPEQLDELNRALDGVDKNLGEAAKNLYEAEKSVETANKELDVAPLEKYQTMEELVSAIDKKAEEVTESATESKEKTEITQIVTKFSAEVAKVVKDAGNACANVESEESCYGSDKQAGITACRLEGEAEKNGMCTAIPAGSTWRGIATFFHFQEKPELQNQLEELDKSLQGLLKDMPKFTQKCVCKQPTPSPELEQKEETTSSSTGGSGSGSHFGEICHEAETPADRDCVGGRREKKVGDWCEYINIENNSKRETYRCELAGTRGSTNICRCGPP